MDYETSILLAGEHGLFDFHYNVDEHAIQWCASIGTLVGITAFAEDLDEADSVTYSTMRH